MYMDMYIYVRQASGLATAKRFVAVLILDSTDVAFLRWRMQGPFDLGRADTADR